MRRWIAGAAFAALLGGGLTQTACEYDDHHLVGGGPYDGCYDDRDCDGGLICGSCWRDEAPVCLFEHDPCGVGVTSFRPAAMSRMSTLPKR